MHAFVSHCCVLTLALCLAATTFAEDPDFASQVDGTWKSDWTLTKKHLDEQCKLSDEAVAGLQRLMGKMTIQYTGKRAVFTMPAIKFTRDGTEKTIEGWTRTEVLDVVGRTKTTIALRTKAVAPPVDGDSISLMHFVDADTYWVYLGDSPLVDMHVREYFRRVPAVEKRE